MKSSSTRGAIREDALDPDANERREAYRRIGRRLIPFLMFLWIMAWLDRVNISFAKLQMSHDLNFSEAVYGLGAGIFYIGYLLFEVPSNLLLQRIGARKTIVRITIGWGLLSAATAFVTTPGMFYLLRFLLGACEAGFYPGIILYLTHWYPSSRRAKVFGVFMSSVALSGVIGGPLAGFLMTHFNGTLGFAGWKWVFIMEGIPSILGGLIALAYLTDKLEHAKWLSARQRALVRAELDRDHVELGPREHDFSVALRDPRLWMFTVIYFCIIVGNATVAFWGPTIVSELSGLGIAQVGWIISGISLCGAAGMIANGTWSDRSGNARKCATMALFSGAMGLLGLALFWQSSPIAGIVAFALALAGAYSTIPVFWQMQNAVFTGTAAAGAIAIINSFGNLGGFVAPYALGMLRERNEGVRSGLVAVAFVEILACYLIVRFVRTSSVANSHVTAARSSTNG